MSGVLPHVKICCGFNRFEEPCSAFAKRGTNYCRHHQPNTSCSLTSLPKSGSGESIDLLNLTTRPYNNLRKAGITSITQLEDRTEDQLYGIVGMGATSVAEIKDRLSTFQERAEAVQEEYQAELHRYSSTSPEVDTGDDTMFDDVIQRGRRYNAREIELRVYKIRF